MKNSTKHPYLNKLYPFWENNPMYSEKTKRELDKKFK